MTFVNKSLDQMMQEINCNQLAYFDFWKPSEFPKRHKERNLYLGKYLDISNDYVDFLISKIPAESNIHPDNLLKSAIILTFENALTRGNHCDINSAVSLKLFSGNKGSIFRIRDSGNGFPYVDFINKYYLGQKVHNGNGNGFIVFDFDLIEVAYEGKGNIINIMIKSGYSPENSLANFQK